jgi:WD40 repeat protein
VTVALILGTGLALLGFADARRKLDQAKKAEQVARDQERLARKSAYAADMNLALQAARQFDTTRTLELLHRYVPRVGEADLRGFEWRYIAGLLQGDSLRTLDGHSDSVIEVGFSLEGHKLFSFSADDFVKTWDVATGQELESWPAQSDATCAAFSQNRGLLASESRTGQLTLWNTSSHELLKETHETDAYDQDRDLAFSPDGKLVATADQTQESIRLWSVPSLQPIALLRGGNGFSALTFSPDGQWLAAGGMDGSVKLWSAHDGWYTVDLPHQTGSIHALCFSSDSKMLAVGTWRGTLEISQISTCKLIRTIDQHAICYSAVFSPDNQTIAVITDDSAIHLWDISRVNESKETTIHPGHRAGMCSIAFSPDAQLLATGSGDTSIRLTRPTPPKERNVMRGHQGPVLSVAISPDNQTIFSGGTDGTVRLWATQSMQARKVYELGGVEKSWIWTLSVSGDGKLLAAGGGDYTKTNVAGPLMVWDLRSGDVAAKFLEPHGNIGSSQFGPDGSTLFTTSNDQIVRAWQPAFNRVQSFSIAPKDRSTRSAISSLSAKGQILATVGWRSGVQLWNSKSGALLQTLTNGPQFYYSVRFSADDYWLAAGRDNGTVELWNTQTWKPISIINGVSAIWALAFSPDGKTLAVGSDDPVIQLWDLETFERVGALEGHTARVHALAFSADGTLLVSGSGDETVRLWRAPTFSDIERLKL